MVQGFTVEAEIVVVMTAAVGWMVEKLVVRVLVGEESLGWMEVIGVDLDVELDRSSVMVTLLQDLQHMRR